jgi:hypothetical protein
LQPGFETFRSDGAIFNECHGRNAGYSSNASGTFLFKNCSILITPISQFPEGGNNIYYHEFSPAVNINRNITPPASTFSSGGLIDGFQAEIQGYINSTNDQHLCISVDAPCPNITITNCFIDYTVDYASPGTSDGPVGIQSTGLDTIVEDCTVTGIVQFGGNFKNITIADGEVTNCTADTIKCELPNCILTP